jgi:hypothetical protein
MKKLKFIAALITSLTALPVSAHFMWLEQTDGQTKLYFGEYDSGLREKIGGRLDTIAAPEALANLTKLGIQRKEDYLLLETVKNQPVVNQAVVAHELTMRVKDLRKNNIGIVKPMYYARIGDDKQAATLPMGLDIQSIGDHKVRVSLDGKPLPKSKLHIYAPNQWGQELDLNETGEVSFVTPWKGLYVLEVVYVQQSNGNYQGDAYEAIRHVSTLSIVQP